jgi:hypothetical protein
MYLVSTANQYPVSSLVLKGKHMFQCETSRSLNLSAEAFRESSGSGTTTSHQDKIEAI